MPSLRNVWKKIRAKFNPPKKGPSLRLQTVHGVRVRVPRGLVGKPPHQRNAHGFSFASNWAGWRYDDRYPENKVTNPIKPADSFAPHLVLRDQNGTPRFTMRWMDEFPSRNGKTTILSIQRERTKSAYRKSEIDPSKYEWFPEIETRLSKEFQARLGMYPPEFLLSQFIFEHRSEIRAGKKVLLAVYLNNPGIENYKGLMERFFTKKPEAVSDINKPRIYELNLKSNRVRKLLAFP